MRYWFDTEFIEDGKTIDLISIGVVAEDGRELYLLNVDCDLSKSSEWVRENVIKQLPPKPCDITPQSSPREQEASRRWKSRDAIREEVAFFLGAIGEVCSLPPTRFATIAMKVRPLIPIPLKRTRLITSILNIGHNQKTEYRLIGKDKPEIWAYYADYDWVAFCQLFGTMMDLPKGFPMYCRDLKQWYDMLGNPKLPEQGKGEHNALEDARWNKQAWEFLAEYDKTYKK